MIFRNGDQLIRTFDSNTMISVSQSRPLHPNLLPVSRLANEQLEVAKS